MPKTKPTTEEWEEGFINLVFDTTKGLTRYLRPELVQELKYRVAKTATEARAEAIEEAILAVGEEEERKK